MGEATREMKKHNVTIRRGNVKVYRDQGIVEQFNQTSSERLFTSIESGDKLQKLPEIVSALNSEVTRLTGKKNCGCYQRKVS